MVFIITAAIHFYFEIYLVKVPFIVERGFLFLNITTRLKPHYALGIKLRSLVMDKQLDELQFDDHFLIKWDILRAFVLRIRKYLKLLLRRTEVW